MVKGLGKQDTIAINPNPGLTRLRKFLCIGGRGKVVEVNRWIGLG